MRALVAAALLSAACQAWNSPYESQSRTVEGCNEAVAHLRTCCKAWDTYLSCTYLQNTVGGTDVSPGQSKCILKKSCDELAKTVESGSYLCGLSLSSNHCR